MTDLSAIKPQWALHFKIDDNTWESLCSQAAHDNVTPLDLALERGILNENKLIQWDRDLSGLASLKDVFFNAEPPKELWANIDFNRCRAAACMPIADWDGVVYWAKLNSLPTGLEDEYPQAVWVLAPWSGMKKWFTQWKSEIKLDGTPSGLNKETLTNLTGINDEVQTLPTPPVIEKTPDEFAAPIGLSKDPVDVNVDFSSVGLDNDGSQTHTQETTPPVHSEPTPAAPQSQIPSPASKGTLDVDLDLGAPPEKFEIPAPEAPKMQEASAILPPLPPEIAEPEIVLDLSEDYKKTEIITETAMPPPLPPPLPAQTRSQSPVPGAGMAMPPPPPPSAVQGTVKVAPTTISLDELDGRLKAAPNQDMLAQVLMAGWQNYFDRVMILLFQKNRLVIWWQTGHWRAYTTRGVEIPLDTPSIFKVVADTGRPYHGYVSQGTINDEFFQKTNGGEYSEHVSIIPVLAGDRVMAMVFGGCSKDAGKQLILSKLEENVHNFSTALTKIISPEKKAS